MSGAAAARRPAPEDGDAIDQVVITQRISLQHILRDAHPRPARPRFARVSCWVCANFCTLWSALLLIWTRVYVCVCVCVPCVALVLQSALARLEALQKRQMMDMFGFDYDQEVCCVCVGVQSIHTYIRVYVYT
jgi:hypothetical protein